MSKTKAISAVLLLMFIGFLFVSSVKQDMSQGQGQGQGQVNSDPVTECYNKCTVSQFVEYKNKLAE